MRRRTDSHRRPQSAPVWWGGPAAGAAPFPAPAPAHPQPEAHVSATGPLYATEMAPPWAEEPPPSLYLPGSAPDHHAEPPSPRGPAGFDPMLSEPPITTLPTGRWVSTAPIDGQAAGPDLWLPERSAPPPAPSAQLVVRESPRSATFTDVVRPADSRSAHGRPRANVERSLAAVRSVDPAEAAQLATCFALDYLSWDEEQPRRRAEVLRQYLPAHSDTTIGWSGAGRQRADFACPGQIEPDGYRLWIDVRVRVTPYKRDGPQSTATSDPPPDPPLPEGARWSSAPAPAARGWVPGASVWMRLAVPVRRHDSGGLVVDLSTIPEPEDVEGPEQ